MISPEEFERIARAIVGGTEERLVAAVSERLVSSLIQGGELTAKDWRDIERLASANHVALRQTLLATRDQIDAQAREAVTKALRGSVADDLSPLRQLYGPAALPETTALFKRISAETVQGVTSVVARQNIKLVESAERLWYDVAGEAVDAWTQKLDTLDNILSRAVGRLSEGSLSVIDYRSGKHYPIDAAVRRHCVSQIGQAGGRLTESILDEYGHELVFTSAHFGSRPEHEVWQGKAYCRSGRKTIDGVTYPDFYRSTGYGDVAGLLGVNCRHSFSAYYPGITELPTIEQSRNGMTSEQYYQATQKQRAYENRIRKTKREIALGEKAGLPMTQKKLELGHQQRLLKGHVEKNGLVRQYSREKAYGIGAQPRGLKRPTPAPSKKLPAGLTASQHTIDRSIERGVSLSHIEDAIKKPLHTLPIKIKNGKPSYQMIGEYATIAINPDTGVITTTWRTGKRTRKKYLSGSP